MMIQRRHLRSALQAVLFFLLLLRAGLTYSQQAISLAGTWKCALDPDSLFYNRHAPPGSFPDSLNLPGSLDQGDIGNITREPAKGRLTRRHTYYGPAWYSREIIIPANWQGETVSLFLERVMWSSTVYLDGKQTSEASSLYTPHIHNLGNLSPGKHTLVICVNNGQVYKIGTFGHGYSDQMQTIWNGIIGHIELRAEGPLSITGLFTYPDIRSPDVRVKTLFRNISGEALAAVVTCRLIDKQNNKEVAVLKREVHISGSGDSVQEIIRPGHAIKLWDEFSPNLYTVEVTVTPAKGRSSQRRTDFGFREIKADQHKILVNGNATFFRLDINNISFPLTGYPPMDEASWEKLFRLYRSYGFNGMRCHSWCPPEAAFKAADKSGMYIEAELVWPWVWKTEKGGTREEWIAKGYTDELGSNPSADKFVPEEMRRIVDAYGNHPSFAFLCIGNELGGSDFNVMKQWVKDIKNTDKRRLYSVSTARTITEADDYNVTHHIPNGGGTYGSDDNNTWNNHDESYKQAKIPIIAHEIGQYPVYPAWKDLDKYTGVLRAEEMVSYRKTAEENGILPMDSAYRKASGALQQLLYKNEFEDLHRTSYCAGYCVLDMEDYTGQGAALVGWLDDFYDSKGVTTPRKVRMHNDDVVLLLSTKSFVFTSDDTLHAFIRIANYSNKDVTGKLYWEIKEQDGKVIHTEEVRGLTARRGQLTDMGQVSYPWANAGNQAKEYTVSLRSENRIYMNEWNFFIYPAGRAVAPGNILIADQWSAAVDERLASGGKVLLLAHHLGTAKTAHAISFSPVFWSLGFFSQQKTQTLGTLIEDKSPLFKHFPTGYYTDWQWYTISKGKYFYLDSFPKSYRPIVEPVPDFHINQRMGAVFEVKVANGKLLVCGYDLSDSTNIVARQLMYSMLEYMNSNAFQPACSLDAGLLKKILVKEAP